MPSFASEAKQSNAARAKLELLRRKLLLAMTKHTMRNEASKTCPTQILRRHHHRFPAPAAMSPAIRAAQLGFKDRDH